MVDTFCIQLATQSDIQQITQLLNAAYKELADLGLNYTASYQNNEITQQRIGEGRCFVMRDPSEKIIGTILMSTKNYFTNHNTAYLGQFGILPDLKKKGLGSQLISFCENLAQKEGYAGIQLDTAIPAEHLVNWYLKRGYKVIGKDHFEGKTYDSYIFEKSFFKN